MSKEGRYLPVNRKYNSKNMYGFSYNKLHPKSVSKKAISLPMKPETINRHWLLHGRSDFEIDEMDCIRLFNAVQSLCMIVKVEAKETQSEN